jgi:hypothetical protein
MSEGGALREIAARFGIEFDDAELKTGVQSIGGAIDRVKEFGAILAANQVVQRIRDFANEFAAHATSLRESAQGMRVSAVDMQAFTFAAQDAGLNAAQASTSLGVFAETLRLATRSGAQQFRALHVAIRGADGAARPFQDVLDDVAGAIGRIENPARKAALAKRYFGENARLLMPILREGKGGLAALRDEFGALGGGTSQEAIEVARAYSDQLRRSQLVADGWRSTIATQLLPWITEATRVTREWSVSFMLAVRQSEAVRAVLLVLGATAAAVALKVMIAWAPVLLPLAKIAAVIALIILVVDDLLVLFRGGDSAIGRFLDSMVGVGASRAFVVALKEAWEGLKVVVADVGAWMTRTWAQLTRDLSDAWEGFQLLFTNLGRFLDGITGGIFRGLWAKISAFFAQIGRGISRIPGLSAVGDSINSLIRDWQGLVFNVGPGGQVQTRTPGAQAATAPARAPARTTNVQQSNNTTINVQGAGDPAAVAREVERRHRDAQGAATRSAAAALQREAP